MHFYLYLIYLWIDFYVLVMEKDIIGRKREVRLLKQYVASDRSEFIALYGRRRIGKTYLIMQLFEGKFAFRMTGIENIRRRDQLVNFRLAMSNYVPDAELCSNWLEAFKQLSDYLENLDVKKKIIFIDEIPWLDSNNSGFFSALENFWNNWAYYRKDIKLIVCGSATTWMLNKLINGVGGLYNRLTHNMLLETFSLAECKEFFDKKHLGYDAAEIIEAYMVFGGVPFYLNKLDVQLSVAQNVDNLLFARGAELRNEFTRIMSSLYKHSENHVKVMEALSKKNKGLTRREITDATKLPSNGVLTKILAELEMCGFVRQYNPFGRVKRDTIYQLVDPFCLFHFNFVVHRNNNQNFWTDIHGKPEYNTWCGYAWEILCLNHIDEIKSALGVRNVVSDICSWYFRVGESSKACSGTQIDLIIDRDDNVINVCEMKYSLDKYEISKSYDEHSRQSLEVFRAQTKTKKTLKLTYITPVGLVNNPYSRRVPNSLVFKDIISNSTK